MLGEDLRKQCEEARLLPKYAPPPTPSPALFREAVEEGLVPPHQIRLALEGY